MTYQSWKAVCPRCSEQNSSALTPCTNCGKGPILYELNKYYQRRWTNFKCQTCHVVYNNTLCRKCGTDISGTVSGGSSIGTVLKVVGAGFVLLILWAWFTNSDDNGNKQGQGYNPSSPKSFGPSAHRLFPPGNFSSEGDIRSVMQAFTDDWNKSDVTAIRSLWCSASVPDATILSKQIGWYGHIDTSVTDIGRSGDKASAEITVTYAGPHSQGGEKEPWFFVNEGGSWKPCSVSFIWTQSHGH
jgi:hypothetical protein